MGVFVLGFWGWLSGYRTEFLQPHHFPDQQDWLLTGDEPAYLMVGLALHRGEGINVRPVVASGAYTNFQGRTLPVRHDNDWTWSNYQARGMTWVLDRSAAWGDAQILWLPPFYAGWLAPMFGLDAPVRRTNALAQAALLTLMAGLLFAPILRRRPWPETAAAGMALFAGLGGIPVGYYTTQAFPELLTLSCVLGALLLYAAGRRDTDLAGDLLGLAALFLTPRSLVAIVLLSLFRSGEGLRFRRWEVPVVHLAGWGGYVAANLLIWGRILPPAAGGFLSILRDRTDLAGIVWVAVAGVLAAALVIGSVVLAVRSPRSRILVPSVLGGWLLLVVGGMAFAAPSLLVLLLQGVFMQVLSRDMGLLFSNPVSFAALIGCVGLLLHRRDRVTLFGLVLLLGYLAVNAGFPDYRAGRCPMGRYQVILNGILIAGLVRYLGTPGAPWRVLLRGPVWILGIGSLVIAYVLQGHPNYWYRDYHPLFGHDLIQRKYHWLPQWGEDHVVLLSLGWIALYTVTFAASRAAPRAWALLHERR